MALTSGWTGTLSVVHERGDIRRYQEDGLYMRQSHAERDFESLGRLS